MKLQDIKNSNDFENYLRAFKSWGDEPHLYDFNYVVHLTLALLDNLRQNGFEAELEDVGGAFDDEQRKFILKLAEYANRTTDAEEDDQ
jgi:hypothetical protein